MSKFGFYIFISLVLLITTTAFNVYGENSFNPFSNKTKQSKALFQFLKEFRKTTNDIEVNIDEVLREYIKVGENYEDVLGLLHKNNFDTSETVKLNTNSDNEIVNSNVTEIRATKIDGDALVVFDHYEIKIVFKNDKVTGVIGRITSKGL